MKRIFSGYVLAGGKSSRMGSDKAFLELGGETFLARAVKALESVCESRVKVVLNQNQAHFIEKIDVPSIFDVYENRGAAGGIHAALQDCESAYALILACDLPFVEKEAIKTLIETAQSAPENVAAIVPRQHDGRVQPLCGVYQTKICLPVIQRLLEKQTSVSMNDFLTQIETLFIEIEHPEKLFFNVNRPEDFQKLNKKDRNRELTRKNTDKKVISNR
jgi:molybdopterin-guanine dinucleotide biosynthesis protein A